MSSVTSELPVIEGAKEASKTEHGKEEIRKDIEQANEMDMQTPLPADELKDDRDIKNRGSEKSRATESAVVNKKTISAKQAASLEKARAARKQKRKDPPTKDGSPAPDVLAIFKDEFANLRGQYQQVHEALQEMQRRIPLQTPLQDQQVIPHRPVKRIKATPKTETYEDIQEQDEQVEYPTHNNPHEAPVEPRQPLYSENPEEFDEMDRYVKRNSRVMKDVFYNNRTVDQRGRTDPSSGFKESQKSIVW